MRHIGRIAPPALLVVVLQFLVSPSARAQTPINAPGAMQPSTGTGVWHVMPMYREIGSHPDSGVRAGEEYVLLSQIAYGLRNNLSLQLDAPLVFSDIGVDSGAHAHGHAGDEDELGLADTTLLLKYRIAQSDPAPTETSRLSLIAGLQIPGSVDAFHMDSSNGAWDPIIGGVFSTVRGRHGFNADALWEFYTGDNEGQSDSLRYDASYLFRISPAQYTAESAGALYAVAELNGFYGTNGDHELYLSPGIMYESRTFTLDATVMIPVHQEVDHRAESEFLLGIGLRISF